MYILQRHGTVERQGGLCNFINPTIDFTGATFRVPWKSWLGQATPTRTEQKQGQGDGQWQHHVKVKRATAAEDRVSEKRAIRNLLAAEDREEVANYNRGDKNGHDHRQPDNVC